MLLRMKKKVFITIHVIIHLFFNYEKNKKEVVNVISQKKSILSQGGFFWL